MEAELNNKIVLTIQKNFPEDKKLISYLADLLCLSKESIYRRLSNKKMFTIKEAFMVLSAMGLSFDDVIGNNQHRATPIDPQINGLSSFEDIFVKMLKSQVDIAKQMHKAQVKETLITLNRLSVIVHIEFKHIFKFLYFKYLHNVEDIPYSFKLSDLTISPQITSLCKEFEYYSRPMENSTYIFDDNIITGVIKEIKHYYKRGLISDVELNLLQEDLHNALDQAERTLKSGKNDYDAKVYHYYSMFDLDTNYVYCNYDDNVMSQFWVYPVMPIAISDPDTCAMHKKWVESLKKYSVLITQASEMMQSKFMNKQRELIINMAK